MSQGLSIDAIKALRPGAASLGPTRAPAQMPAPAAPPPPAETGDVRLVISAAALRSVQVAQIKAEVARGNYALVPDAIAAALMRLPRECASG